MKTISTLICLSLVFAKLSAQSPISITSINMPVINDTFRVSLASLSSIGAYTATGANYSWDFSTLDSTNQQIRKFQPGSSTPYAFYFFPPKYGEKTLDSIPIPSFTSFSIKNIYSFYRKNSTSSFNAEGMGLTMNGIPVGVTNSDEDELYYFPLNYGDRDSSTFKMSTPTTTMIPFSYKKEGYRITEVDGWGTITTPYGTAPCLRVVTTQYSKDTVTINAIMPPFNKFGFPNNMRSYQWLTLGERIPYLEVSGNVVGGNFTPTQARYRDVIRVFAGIKENTLQGLLMSVFPNPAKDKLTLVLGKIEGKVTVEMTDLQGKLLKSFELTDNTGLINTHTLDIGEFTQGLYLLNLNNKSGKQSIKFSIQ